MKLVLFPLVTLLLVFTSALPHHMENVAPTRPDSGRPRGHQTSIPSSGGIRDPDQIRPGQDDNKESDSSAGQPNSGAPDLANPISNQPNAPSMSDKAKTIPDDEATTPAQDEDGGSGEGSTRTPTSHNQYPYSGNCGGLDKWSFNACQCTSFVAWKLNVDGGINFNNRFKSQRWGNANNWDDAARGAGLTVDNNPAIGSIAQSDAGGYGHVAWVSEVMGNNVQIEEFNFNSRLEYHTHTIGKAQFKYIHFN
jgi:surface antigen